MSTNSGAILFPFVGNEWEGGLDVRVSLLTGHVKFSGAENWIATEVADAIITTVPLVNLRKEETGPRLFAYDADDVFFAGPNTNRRVPLSGILVHDWYQPYAWIPRTHCNGGDRVAYYGGGSHLTIKWDNGRDRIFSRYE